MSETVPPKPNWFARLLTAQAPRYVLGLAMGALAGIQLSQGRVLLGVNYLAIAVLWLLEANVGRLRQQLGYHLGYMQAMQDSRLALESLRPPVVLPTSLREPSTATQQEHHDHDDHED